MLVELQAQDPSLNWAVTAESLPTGGTLCNGYAKATETLEYMLDAGHRYKSLEIYAGKGVTFLLGTELPESW
jgi:hypothetical protein